MNVILFRIIIVNYILVDLILVPRELQKGDGGGRGTTSSTFTSEVNTFTTTKN